MKIKLLFFITLGILATKYLSAMQPPENCLHNLNDFIRRLNEHCTTFNIILSPEERLALEKFCHHLTSKDIVIKIITQPKLDFLESYQKSRDKLFEELEKIQNQRTLSQNQKNNSLYNQSEQPNTRI